MNRKRHARGRREALAAVHLVISVKLLLPRGDKRRIHHFEGLKTKQNDDGRSESDLVKEQIRLLLQVTNGARSVLYMHDGNNGVVVTESAPEMGPARAATGEARRGI